MKLLKKLIPIGACVTTIATITPTTLTSCGNVYTDILKSGYKSKFTPLPKGTKFTEAEATKVYFDALKKYGSELIKDDLLWSANGLMLYAGDNRVDITGDQGEITWTKFLLNVSKCKLVSDSLSSDGYFKMSYTMAGELEEKMTNINGSTSYKIAGTQYKWEMKNIAFSVRYYQETFYGYSYRGWMLVPQKYSPVEEGQGGFWNELSGDEYISFSVRSVVKGYSEKGIQNFGYEDTEQAIIDEQHKYTPRLNEPMTNLFLYDSGYLYNVEKKEG